MLAKPNKPFVMRAMIVSTILVIVCGVSLFVPAHSAKAANPSCGDVVVSGSAWAGSNGVDARSNGADENTANSCAGSTAVFNLNANPPQWGLGWQCVELAGRMYKTRNWSNGVAVSYAAQIYTNAASLGYTSMANGSVNLANIFPGDMIVSDNYTYGHVVLVDNISGNTINVVEQNALYTGRAVVNFANGTLTRGKFHITGVVHSPNNHLTNSGSTGSPSTPVAISRTSDTMAVFYNDGNNHLVNWSWDVNTGWNWYRWDENIAGQPAVVSRASDSIDVFYRTAEQKLVTRGWTAANGWSDPNVLLSSGVAGDPAVVARTSGDMQVFFRTAAGEIKSVSWNSQTGWNTNAQMLYANSAAGDPAAISRSSSSMDVFFGKNNHNLVHLAWGPSSGWSTEDWTANLTGRPTAITRNGGGSMSVYYQETNNYIAERAWDWQTGWSTQDWAAQLMGSPSAITRSDANIDVFYRETGGNIVDRYWSNAPWATTNAANSGATGNPYAIVRGTAMEVFYWSNSTLMDAHWDATNGWSAAPAA